MKTKQQQLEMFRTLLESSRTGEKVNVKQERDTLHVTDKDDPMYLHNTHEIMDMAEVCGLTYFVMFTFGAVTIVIF